MFGLPPLSFWVKGSALAILVSMAPLIYAWYRAAVTEFESSQSKAAGEAEKANVHWIKDRLGQEMTFAGHLLNGLNSENVYQIDETAGAWKDRTNLIEAAYGEGEATLFLTDTGYVLGDNSDLSRLRNWLDGRRAKLADLLRRTDTLPLRKGFDPKSLGGQVLEPSEPPQREGKREEHHGP